MIVRKATAQDASRIEELFAIAFEQPMTRGELKSEENGVHSWAAFDDDGEMMSTFCVSDYTIHFDGNHCKMGGIGGVATLPQYRRRGGIRGCFEAALPDMYEKGYEFSYLYPFSTAYYRKFGYECCVQKLLTTLDLSLLKDTPVAGHFKLADQNHPVREELRCLDSLWESEFNMMVIHADKDYDFAEKCDPAVRQEFTYVYYDQAGAPKAYTTFCKVDQRDGRNLVCTWLFFADMEGFHALMHLFKSLSTDHRHVKFVLPNLPAMQYLMPEWSLGAAQWTLQSAGMVRAVNVKKVLEKARYRGSGSVTMKIRDAQIPQNNRRFAVVFENNRAVTVEQTQAEPDIVLEIPTFSALIAGVWDFEDAGRWMNGLEIRRENPCFAQVFYRKNLMIVDYF